MRELDAWYRERNDVDIDSKDNDGQTFQGQAFFQSAGQL
jgi:hypothetical protein